MCCPFAFSTTCGASNNDDPTLFTFSKVILSPEETQMYQVPWEQQQKSMSRKSDKRMFVCWCCLCSCFFRPVNKRHHRKVTGKKIERKAVSYKNLIDETKPTIEKVKLWSSDFNSLLNDKGGRYLFSVFLQQEHSDENLQFWEEVNVLRQLAKLPERREKMKNIYFEFLRPLAAREVNISSTIRKKIEEDLSNNPPDNVFDAAQKQVTSLMNRQSFPRFLVSELYNTIAQSAYAAGASKVTTTA